MAIDTDLSSPVGEVVFPDNCGNCHACVEKSDSTLKEFLVLNNGMLLCPICYNKRCPKASDHHLACTNSNDPGQPGSIYTAYAPPPGEPNDPRP